MAQLDKDIEINGEKFSLDKIPDASCALVAQMKVDLLGSIDLQGLASDLGKLGNLIYLAYIEVQAHTQLQIEILDVGHKIVLLADKSELTVHHFKITSREALLKLKKTYQYLLDGREKMALRTLTALAEQAKKMEAASEELYRAFDKVSEDINSAIKDLPKATSKRAKKRKLETELEKAKRSRNAAMEAESSELKLYNDAQNRSDLAHRNQTSGMEKLKDIFRIAISGVAAYTNMSASVILTLALGRGDYSVSEEVIRQANAEKIKHWEEKLKQQNLRQEANKKMIELAGRIKNCKDEEYRAEIGIEALNISIGALNRLYAIMRNAAVFWKHMKTLCGEVLANDDVQSQVEEAIKEYNEKDRLEIWTSAPFKETALYCYANWVALEDVCNSYMAQIKETRENLDRCWRENPIEMSLHKVKELAESFQNHLQQDQERIEERSKEIRLEMENLKKDKIDNNDNE